MSDVSTEFRLLQAVQDRLDHVTIKLASPVELRLETRARIEGDLVRHLGRGARAETVMVDAIEAEPSGKCVPVMSVLDPLGGGALS